MQYSVKLATYYDLIFTHKNYKKEVDFIKKMCYCKDTNLVLDVGCGTGTHSILLAEEEETNFVLGIDESKNMIKVASEKCPTSTKIKFVSQPLGDVPETNFDVIISMFNVINHISSLEDIREFFREVSKRLDRKGSFIFDCWNGAATLRDPPSRERRSRLSTDKMSIITTCTPEINFMESQITMNNEIEIFKSGVVVDSFDYSLKHTIWTPKTIEDLLRSAGFKHIRINKHFIDEPASSDDYKLVYICKLEEGSD